MLLTTACTVFGKKADAQDSPCVRMSEYGKISFCLPALDSLVECYADTGIQRVTNMVHEPGQTIAGFYMSKIAIKVSKEASFIPIDDHVKIFTIDHLKDFDCDTNYLAQVTQAIYSQAKIEDWATMRARMETNKDFISYNQPIFIEQFSIRPGVQSFSTIFKVRNGYVDELSLGILNIILVKKRLIGLTFFGPYQNQESLDKAKQKNERYVQAFVAANQ